MGYIPFTVGQETKVFRRLTIEQCIALSERAHRREIESIVSAINEAGIDEDAQRAVILGRHASGRGSIDSLATYASTCEGAVDIVRTGCCDSAETLIAESSPIEVVKLAIGLIGLDVAEGNGLAGAVRT